MGGEMSGFWRVPTSLQPISEWGAFLKIVEDYVIGILCLILFLPAMAVIALAIKCDSKGPVLFRQKRQGLNHEVIEVLKFRTTAVVVDGTEQAKQGGKRFTRIGIFLRRTSLDQLPQFWNVIRGEMSIVGPQPRAVADNTYCGNPNGNSAIGCRTKPGITGWAQIHGFRDETENSDIMAKRLRYDLEYLENWSLRLDLKILIMTPLSELFHRSTS